MDRYTAFGIEKPFPWLAALGVGLLGGVVLSGLLSWAFAPGACPLLEKIIDDRPQL